MAESGGPTNQDGIFYQNSIAAQYLADLLSLQQLQPRETVVAVRVEAPAHVDDIVVSYADGHRDWIQAKSNLQRSGDAWAHLWHGFIRQSTDAQFGSEDQLVIALGRRGTVADALQVLIERAQSSDSEQEWRSRLKGEAAKTLEAVEDCIGASADLLAIFRRISLRVVTLIDVEDMFRRLDLGAATAVPKQLLSLLRDLIGNESRIRGVFRASSLRVRLAEQFGIDIFEPREWGLAAYRDVVRRMARVEIPGRGFSVPVEEIFVWPRAIRLNPSSERDFEDETPRWDVIQDENSVDLSTFPTDGLDRCILVAGPGFGKSTLISAVADKLTRTPIVPVEVSLGTLSLTEDSVLEHLDGRANRDYSVRVDWRRLAEQGLICVLFDGLDEVPTGKRASLIKRVSLFSSRFSSVPWILTVRDPGVLSGPLDAELVELQPLNNEGIHELVRKFKTWSSALEGWRFTENLSAYPDLARFARIPLFLSIMLARWSPSTPLPIKRSSLIEVYLASLFDKENKGEASVETLDGKLRATAQAIAYSCLEREEVGLSDRQALQIVGNYHQGPRDRVLGHLVANGVLRRRIDGRLQFPYPIVQEYLAAIHLVDVAPDQLSRRVNEVVKRPWAQVLQFALELVDDPSSNVREILDLRDDVFSTNLRLVGRCVANGAAVDAQLRDEIGSRLAELWGKAGYQIREKVGRLVVDCFSKPLHLEVRRRLGWGWLLGSGAGEIVTRANDPVLTREVVAQLLEGRLQSVMSLREIEVPLQSIAADVAEMAVNRAVRQGTTSEELEGIADFLERIRLDEVHSKLVKPIADDENMPLFIRFAAYAAMAGQPPESIVATAKAALDDKYWLNQSASLRILARAANPEELVANVLSDSSITEKGKVYVLRSIDRLIHDKLERANAVDKLLNKPGLTKRHRQLLKVWAVIAGDRTRFIELVEEFDIIDSDVAQVVLSNLNSFPEREVGELACKKIRARSIAATELPGFVESAVTGLTCTVENFGWSGYGIERGPRHPAFQAWIGLFDDWLSVANLSKIQRLRLVNSMVEIRPELTSEIQSFVLGVIDPDDDEWDEDDYGHHLRRAMDHLRSRRITIPLSLAEKFALARRPNLFFAGVAAITAVASEQSLNRLISLYRRVAKSDRSFLLDAIDVLASRLDVKVMPEHLEGNPLFEN